jgi:hypothetical protein
MQKADDPNNKEDRRKFRDLLKNKQTCAAENTVSRFVKL